MKKYTFELTVHEGSDEFWEDINKRNVTGCDEVRELVKATLLVTGITLQEDYEFSNNTLVLKAYTNNA